MKWIMSAVWTKPVCEIPLSNYSGYNCIDRATLRRAAAESLSVFLDLVDAAMRLTRRSPPPPTPYPNGECPHLSTGSCVIVRVHPAAEVTLSSAEVLRSVSSSRPERT
ncbi:hypothetical protein EYF80_008880 [Liparis tanakae]|uniref:Uncharacterized protein n=1 Tax=Liparis tanakae TaxID=230148 RepID=A0A4Z2ISK2_9TELE|nr:hypothetical protein EYF80_008880 [Liparis tanakae]